MLLVYSSYDAFHSCRGIGITACMTRDRGSGMLYLTLLQECGGIAMMETDLDEWESVRKKGGLLHDTGYEKERRLAQPTR